MTRYLADYVHATATDLRAAADKLDAAVTGTNPPGTLEEFVSGHTLTWTVDKARVRVTLVEADISLNSLSERILGEAHRHRDALVHIATVAEWMDEDAEARVRYLQQVAADAITRSTP